MELDVQPLRPSPPTLGSLEPSHLWVVGLAGDEASPVVAAARRPYSFMGDCECPDDCPRDHANE